MHSTANLCQHIDDNNVEMNTAEWIWMSKLMKKLTSSFVGLLLSFFACAGAHLLCPSP